MLLLAHCRDTCKKYVGNYTEICDFFGVEFKKYILIENRSVNAFLRGIKENDATGVIIFAEALQIAGFNVIVNELSKIKKETFIHVAEIDAMSIPEVGISIKSVNDNIEYDRVEFTELNKIAEGLGVQKVPIHDIIKKRMNYLNGLRKENVIMSLGGVRGITTLPIYAHMKIKGVHVFLSTKNHYEALKVENILTMYKMVILQYFPLIITLKYIFRENLWHYPEVYANFTVDDPWLRESYGHLNYRDLLSEMKKNKFHTTIAFIPWNYKRNKKAVVEMFKKYPEYYSLCVHGNNHDRREFYRYTSECNDKFPAKPLHVQENNIKQAKARMDEMKMSTGVNYDNVMVFPHNVAPAKTLALLKRYGFLSTVNVNNIPLGEDFPCDPIFYLDTVTTRYEDFPSVRRFNARLMNDNTKKWVFSYLLFLGCPLLMHEHHQIFKNGIDFIGSIARKLNANGKRIINWSSLGDISKKLYKVRRVEDNKYEIFMIADEILVENGTHQELRYSIMKKNEQEVQVELYVDEQSIPTDTAGDIIKGYMALQPNTSCHVKIHRKKPNISWDYNNSKKFRYLYLRIASDLRDNNIYVSMHRRFTKLKNKIKSKCET